MTQDNTKQVSNTTNEFESQALKDQTGLLREFWDFLKHNKKWWLTPIILVLLIVGLVVILSAVAPVVAPFIYTLF